MAEPYRIHCSEIWEVPNRSTRYFTVRDIEVLNRVAIADVRGQGEEVGQSSGWLYQRLEQQMNCLDGQMAPPLLLHQRKQEGWRRLEPGNSLRANLPLGVLPDAQYSQISIAVEPGDRIFLYTDGLSECSNQEREEFGEQRLLAILSA
jgi:serine phosphatase RsbU (regulator of sigma subunit)